MKSARHVFISFKTEERHHAIQLKEALDKSGYFVWWQEAIQCGQEWHGAIDKAIKEAGAIVVLWSLKSMKSTWVRHEASQAIVMNVYTPVRVDVMEIELPFNREQATDLINWTGDIQHPGFQNILRRLDQLMPPPIPFWQRVRSFVWDQKVVIALVIIAGLALYLLYIQGRTLGEQTRMQQDIVRSAKGTVDQLTDLRAGVDSQFGKINNLNMELDKKIALQAEITDQNQRELVTINNSLKVTADKSIEGMRNTLSSVQSVDTSLNKALNDIRRNLYPIDVSKMGISFLVYWDVTSEELKNYTKRVMDYVMKEMTAREVEKSIRERVARGLYPNLDSIGNYFLENGVKARFLLDRDNRVKIWNIWIEGQSVFMPDCSIYSERSVARCVASQRLQMRFEKVPEGETGSLNVPYLGLLGFVENQNPNCEDQPAFYKDDELPPGRSNVDIGLQFEGDTLSSFWANYFTKRLSIHLNSGDLVSILDLVDSRFNLNNGNVGCVKVVQISNVMIMTNGESRFGSININEWKSYSNQPQDFSTSFKMKREYFNSKILDP